MDTGSPLVGRLDRGVVRVEGADRASFLDDVLSQSMADQSPGTVRSALFLDMHGTPRLVMDVLAGDEAHHLLLPLDLLDPCVEVLGGRTFLADVRFAATDLVVAAWRPVDPDGSRPAGSPAEGDVTRPDDLLLVGRRHGLDVVGPSSQVDAWCASATGAGATAASREAFEGWRVRAGEPAWGREIAAPHLPEEMGLLPTHVHLSKGCYPGQEAVARQWMLGRPRRALAVIAGPETLQATTYGTGRDGVTVTSVGPLEADGQRVALAYVPATARPGDSLELDAVAVEVVDLVGSDRPVVGHDPNVRRRRDGR